MSFDQTSLDDLAARYTEAWNSKVPENVAACHVSTSRITINRGEPSVGHDELTAMAAGFHSEVPDLVLQNDGIRSAGNHVMFLWTFTDHPNEDVIFISSLSSHSSQPFTIRGFPVSAWWPVNVHKNIT